MSTTQRHTSKRLLLFEALHRVRHSLPGYAFKYLLKILPLNTISVFFDVLSLATLIPLFNVLLDPGSVKTNPYLGKAYDYFGFESMYAFLFAIILGCLITFIVKNLIITWVLRVQSRLALHLAQRLSVDLLKVYLEAPYSFYSESNRAILLRNFAYIPFEIVTYTILPIAVLVNELLIIVIILAALMISDPVMVLLLIGSVIPFYFLFRAFFKKRLQKFSERANTEHESMYKKGSEILSSFVEIRLFGKRDYFLSSYQKSISSYSTDSSRIFVINNVSPRITEVLSVFLLLVIFAYGWQTNQALPSVVNFIVLFAIASYRLIPSLNKCILNLNYLRSSMPAFETYRAGYHSYEKETVTEKKHVSFTSEVRFSHVDYSYNETDTLFNNLNITIKKGQTIGLVGESGSGKSSFIKLFMGLDVVKKGRIEIDGTALTSETIESWHQHINYVPQQITLIDGTIRDNIAFGVEAGEINQHKVETAAGVATIHDFILSLPQGYDTPVGDNGIKLSGGQRQRIGIARALFHGGSILIFDEATSALDPETEKTLLRNIKQHLDKTHTIVMATHRHDALAYCDNVFQFEKGMVTEATTFKKA